MDIDAKQLGTAPISESVPQGSSVKYDPEYEELQAEMGKLQGVGGGIVNWAKVVELGRNILSAKSKDFQVATYLAYALLQRQGIRGFLAGLEVCLALLQNYWETMYPEIRRVRGRISAMEWLSGIAGRHVPGGKYSPADLETFRNIEEVLKAIDSIFREKVPEQSVDFSELNRAVRDARTNIETKVVAKDAPAAAKTGGGQVSAGLALPESILSDADAQKVLKETRKWNLKAAAFLRGQSLSNPLPYRISRAALWDSIEEPPSAENGVTHMPPIPPYVKEARKQVIEKGEPEAILSHGEEAFPNFPFWLDLQCEMDAAVSSLDPSFGGVRSVIREELGILLRRCPGLMELQFQDATPFASPETVDWVGKNVLSAPEKTNVSQKEGAAKRDELDEAYAKARSLAKKKKFKEAVSIFQEKMARITARRERFLWNLHLARVLIAGGKLDLAWIQLEALDREVKEFSLEQWEPNLCEDVLGNLILCGRKLSRDVSGFSERLFRVNPGSVLSLDGS